MVFDEIIHGTQYYRTPTPLPDEWEGDLANMADYGIDAIQIRINWRWNERKENEYDFSDVDRLMELAEKNNKKVIIKFLLECAPQYIFDKYGGTRIGPRGEQLRGGSHGAFYGGWRPCFTNPKVQERAVLFVEKVAERYAGHKNLFLWNAWNEIRNKPIEDCYCPHCRKAFGDYLREQFKTVENLNAFYGSSEESFETIALPVMPHGVWDIYAYKKFKGSYEMYEWLKFVTDAIKKYDKVHPVMAHVGFCAAFQTHLGDICDDYTASKAVDFFGSSIPCDCAMDTQEKRLDYLMLNAYVRSIDEDYFMHEIYPGAGRFKKEWYDTPFDMEFKLYSSLASGTKGLVYWQYRAERVGHECDCSGIMRMDGSPRPVAYEVQKFGRDLHRDMKYFAKAKREKSDIAIVFDFDSMLMSEIEDSWGNDYEFDLFDPIYYYRNAHAGVFRLAKKLNYRVDYVNSTDTSRFKDYKVLHVPYGSMIQEKTVEALAEFAKEGGTVILDEGFALRQPNTWINPYQLNCKSLISVWMEERREMEEFIEYNGKKVKLTPCKTEYKVENSESILCFENDKTAIHKVVCGKGTVYLLGFSLGYGYYTTEDVIYEEMFEDLIEGLHLSKQTYSDFKNGIYEFTLEVGATETITFLFNVSGKEKIFGIEGEVCSYGGDFKVNGIQYCLGNNQIGYFIRKVD